MDDSEELTAERRDRLSPVWDMSQERVLAPTLINQRFNFLLLFFSVIVGGAINARDPQKSAVILSIGAIVSWLLVLIIAMAQKRLRTIMKIISQDKSHPYAIVNRESGQYRGIQPIVSYFIAPFCSVILTIGAAGAIFGQSIFR